MLLFLSKFHALAADSAPLTNLKVTDLFTVMLV
jgi:hypothetical protein